jgi:hypothetical protein
LQLNWKLRCDHRHGHDSDSKEIALVKFLHQEIRLLYDLKDKVLLADSDKFYSSADEHFSNQTTSRELQQWILTWKPTILHSVTQATQMGINPSMGIRRFFSSARSMQFSVHIFAPANISVHKLILYFYSS